MTTARYLYRLGQAVSVSGGTTVWRIVHRHHVRREPRLPYYAEYMLAAPNGVWRVEHEADLEPVEEDTP